jgi:thiamine pyrophosphate-dependent acetolactate synthase large subunit-like protein
MCGSAQPATQGFTAGLHAMSKKVADIIVETLQKAGVRHCYGVVGDTLNLIAQSLAASKIEWVHMRHEEAGAFAAQAEALVSGHLTAVAGSCGPGSLHFINGIFEANRNRAPVPNRFGETRCRRSYRAGGYFRFSCAR